MYFQQIAIIIFTTRAKFCGGSRGRIEWARGPYAAPGPHVGQPCLIQSTEIHKYQENRANKDTIQLTVMHCLLPEHIHRLQSTTFTTEFHINYIVEILQN